MRFSAFGLRPKLLAALVLTSAVTLIFAAFALLSPLKDRLRTDGTQTLLAAAGAAKPGFEEIDLINGRLDPVDLVAQVGALERRSGARVIIFNAKLRPIYDTAKHDPIQLADVRQSLKTGNVVHVVQDEELRVAQPFSIDGSQYVIALRERLTYVQEATHVVQDAFLEAAAVGLLVALVLGIGLSATLLRRLERLRDLTRRLDIDGIHSPPPPPDGSRDEIGEVSRAFAAMHASMRRQEDARRAFVATASHELRTPLASLDGMLELLADDLDSDPPDFEDARDRIQRAQEQSRRLASLAADLLNLSRLDAATTLRSEPIELTELARAVLAEFELRAADRNVKLATVSTTAPCWGQGDPGSVAQIARILLDNALRVAPPLSTVTVSLNTPSPEHATIAVHDDGPGIPPQERALIFERFRRGSGQRPGSGFGLGLAIGRELATRMSGTLELHDNGPGTTFVLCLPGAHSGGDAR